MLLNRRTNINNNRINHFNTGIMGDTMTNQLEEELRAIRNTIIETEKQKKTADEYYYNYLNRKLDKLRYEEKRILHEMGITGSII